MIIFNGQELEDIAPDIRIEDIRVSPIEYNVTARPRAITGGSDFVRTRNGTRTVTINFGLQISDQEARWEELTAISEWARTDGEYRLDLPQYPDHYLVAVCTAKPEPSLRQWWEAKLRIVFTCYDNPYLNSIREKSAECGTAFRVAGDAPPLMRIERTLASAAEGQSYGNGTETMTFSDIPAGSLVIDLNRQTAAVDGSSIMSGYQVSSRFLIPRTGTQTITGTGTVKYRERWQ